MKVKPIATRASVQPPLAQGPFMVNAGQQVAMMAARPAFLIFWSF